MFYVYKITSPSGKSYIGQTRQSIGVRFKQHIQAWKKWLDKGQPRKPYSTKLFYAFSKYGPENFTITTLGTSIDYKQANILEEQYISHYNSIIEGYNVMSGGEGWKNSKLKEEHKEKISLARKSYFKTLTGQERKQELSKQFKENNPSKKGRIPWNVGKTYQISGRNNEAYRTKEHRQKLGEITKKLWKMGVFDNRPSMTEETKKKIGEKQKGHPGYSLQKQRTKEIRQQTYRIIPPNGESFIITNLSQFCRENNLTNQNISRSGSRGYKAEKIIR